MLDQTEAPLSERALFPTVARGEAVGALLALSGTLLLILSPSTALSAASLALLVAGLALLPALGPVLIGLVLPFYLHPKPLGSMEFSLPELILLSGVLGASIYTLRHRGRFRRSLAGLATPLDGPVAIFLAAALLSLLASEVPRVSLRDLRILVLEPVAAYYLAVWFLRDRSDLLAVASALLLGGAAAAISGLYQYLFTDHVVAVEGVRRVLGPYLSPNHLGLYLGRLLPIAVALLLFLPRVRIPAALLSATLAAALLLTFSVGSWLASAVALLAVALLRRPRTAFALAGAFALLLVAAAPVLRLERIASHFSLSGGTSFLRLRLWESSLQMIRDHPLLGVGMDNFLYHYRTAYMLPEAAAEPNLSHPHNLILNFWLQMGILGLASVVWLLYGLARLWLRLWHTALDPVGRALLAGIAGATVDLVVHGMVDNSYFLVDLAFHFWLCAAAVVILDKLRPQP
ncbi:MAG: O-antigen ligase family protein [Sphingomonadaceae bacterium]